MWYGARVCGCDTCAQCAKAALFHMELEERQEAKQRAESGPRKARKDSSREGGEEAASHAKEVAEVLNLAAPYYAYDFADRFIKVKLDEATGQPTTTTIDALKAQFKE